MGRVSKVKIDKIKSLFNQGYTKKEISERLKVSRGTVAKYAEEEGPHQGNKGHSPVLYEFIKAFYELLVVLNISPYLEEEFQSQYMEDEALKLTKRIINVDEEFGKRILKGNPYVHYLESADILRLSVPNSDLEKRQLRLRTEWIRLFRQYYPEKLADLIKTKCG